LTLAGVKRLAAEPEVEWLQCEWPVSDGTWLMLNEHFCPLRPDVGLRIYTTNPSREYDLGFVRHLTNVRRFAADCLWRARNVEAIAEIPHLESLSLGIYELDDFSVLGRVAPTLTELHLTATRSRKPSLAPLSRFRSLRCLSLEGHTKSIEVLSELQNLEDLTLRSITTPDLAYLAPLSNLWSLDIKLGGIRDFTGVTGKTSIKYLELWQIRKLSDVSFISTLTGLQNLWLESLANVASFPAVADCKELRRILILNLKTLHDFAAIEFAPALEEFQLIEGIKLTAEGLLPVLRNPTVRRVHAGFSPHQEYEAFCRLQERYGKAPYLYRPFEYR
jgi:hypothetical protein